VVYALGFVLEEAHPPFGANQRGLLVINKGSAPQHLQLDATMRGAVATVLEGVGEEPGYTAPRVAVIGADLRLSCGPYCVATVMAAD
jgi:hypothetical protein